MSNVWSSNVKYRRPNKRLERPGISAGGNVEPSSAGRSAVGRSADEEGAPGRPAP